MLINTGSLTDLFRGYRTLFDAALQGATPVSDDVIMRVSSANKQEKYAWLGAVPGMRQLLDEVQIKNLSASNYTITNLEFEDTVAVPRFDIETDNYGIYNPFFTAMGQAAKFEQDILVFGLMIGGFAGAASIDYTGTSFFSAGKKRSANDPGFSNILATAGNAQANAPLNAYSYRAARANLMSRTNAAGRPMNLGRKLVLVVGAAMEPIARQILVADTVIQANTGNTSVAAVTNVDKGTAQILTTALIDASANPNAWFLLELGLAVKPFVWQVNKEPYLIAQISEESEANFLRKEFRYQAYGRFNAGYLMPELAFGSAGTGTAMTQYP